MLLLVSIATVKELTCAHWFVKEHLRTIKIKLYFLDVMRHVHILLDKVALDEMGINHYIVETKLSDDWVASR